MFVVLVIAAALCFTQQSRASETPDSFDAQVDALFAVSVRGDSPGGMVLVGRDGKVVFEKGYGLADVGAKTPISGEMRFRIGSITKQFTAAAVLKLAEQGRLAVDDPVSKFFADWPRGNEVRLRHLLTHSSGIHNFTTKPGFDARVRQPVPLDKLLASFKDDPYDFNPGEKYSYCNSGYVLLGAIIEKVSGEGYGNYLRKTFFEPLGMNDTGVYPSGGGLPHEALGYSFEKGAVTRAIDWDMSNVATAGELYSTAHDLFRWNEALFGGKVLSAKSMWSAFSVGVLKDDDPTHPEDTGYGYGWTIDRLNGAREISHGGELAGFGSYLLRLPDYKLTVVVLLNCVPQQPGLQQWVLARQVARLALGGELPKSDKPKVVADLPPGALGAIVGKYDMGHGMIMAVTAESGRTYIEIAGRKRFEILPKTDRDFFVESGGAEATFVRDSKNQVVKAILKQGGDRIDAPKLP